VVHCSLADQRDEPVNAEVQKVVRLSDVPEFAVSEVTGHPPDQGRNWELIARAVNGSVDLNLGVYSMGPNQLHPPHYHPLKSEFYYILEGSCLVRVDDEEIEGTPGTAFYLPAGTVHAVRTRASEQMTLLYGFPCGDFREAGTVWLEETP
jgi:quercetin dioxygenase-like cupin family protein